jgi:hypothetical protein
MGVKSSQMVCLYFPIKVSLKGTTQYESSVHDIDIPHSARMRLVAVEIMAEKKLRSTS